MLHINILLNKEQIVNKVNSFMIKCNKFKFIIYSHQIGSLYKYMRTKSIRILNKNKILLKQKLLKYFNNKILSRTLSK